MQVPRLLLDTLEDLSKENFDSFQWHLQMDVLEGCKPIPKAYLENVSRRDTVTQMTTRYGDDLAVKISVEILKRMRINSVAEKLNNTYAAGKQAVSPSAPSSAVPPATVAPTISAQSSVVIAPHINCGSSAGNVTINLTNPGNK